MTGEYELLKKVLSTIEVKEGLNKDNIIEEIQEELKEQGQGLYQEWEKGKFDVNHGFSLNISGIEYSKLPLLIIAAQNGYTKTVKALIQAGANVNAVDQCKRTPLHHAALNGRVDTVEVLLKEGAKVNSVDQYEMTALHNAAENNHKKIVEVLIANKANIDAKNFCDNTALYCAVLNKNANIVNALIKAGANVKAVNKGGEIPVDCARKNLRVDVNIVNALIATGANVNAVDKNGKTPLDCAHENVRVDEDIVNALIAAEANVNAVDRDERTSLDYAESKNVKKAMLEKGEGSFLKASRKGKIAGGVTILLGTAIAVALFTTGIIAAQLIPIVISVVAIAAALVVGYATYAWSKPSTKVGEVEKPPVVLTTNEQRGAAI
ncbi:ankyrin repeat domain-containing protein [Wolbachia endosymbiont of Nilaparvata lugens]|uniref:ankyrin repeat domain-containing protein n=1 Tax=Wolbachia endosymbiont of Nilaparvata lugens TaxID=357143 RepID=UPI00117DD91E|nr:ankyrin repeat domain-containing protein [Wolbachia endosymbiont of Nilaparvata lugens]